MALAKSVNGSALVAIAIALGGKLLQGAMLQFGSVTLNGQFHRRSGRWDVICRTSGFGAPATSKMYPGNVCFQAVAKLTSTAAMRRKAAVRTLRSHKI